MSFELGFQHGIPRGIFANIVGVNKRTRAFLVRFQNLSPRVLIAQATIVSNISSVLFDYLPYRRPYDPVADGLSSRDSVSPSVSPSPQNWPKRAKNGVIFRKRREC